MSQMKRVAEAAAKLRDSLHFGIMDFPERMGDLEECLDALMALPLLRR